MGADILSAPATQLLSNLILGALQSRFARENAPKPISTAQMMGFRPGPRESSFSETVWGIGSGSGRGRSGAEGRIYDDVRDGTRLDRGPQIAGILSGLFNPRLRQQSRGRTSEVVDGRSRAGGLRAVDDTAGGRAWSGVSPFGRYMPTGQPPDPDAIQRSLIEDVGNAYRAAVTERDRALDWGRRFTGELGDIREAGLGFLSDIGEFRRDLDYQFRDAKLYANNLYGFASQLPDEIRRDVAATTARALAVYGTSVGAARDAMERASMETAKYLEATREGIDRQTEDHKARVAAEMAAAGYDHASIQAALHGIDYEKGSVLLAQSGAIAAQQSQRIADLMAQLSGTITSAGSALTGALTNLSGTLTGGLVSAGQLMESAARTVAGVSEMDAQMKSASFVAEATYRSALDGLRAQGMYNAANFMASIQEPVLMTSPVFMNMMAVYQNLIGEDNAAAMTAFQAQMMPFTIFQSALNQGFGLANQARYIRSQEGGGGTDFGGILGGSGQFMEGLATLGKAAKLFGA